ncbi:MAG TPA: SpoIID/LytB domain-containing protein [Actinomycetota bacterium]|nr:SpoIID/LytB domain-containing protein [Actinomycetota bacterium]
MFAGSRPRSKVARGVNAAITSAVLSIALVFSSSAPASALMLGDGTTPYVFTGAGYGHGVGMSQYGAKGGAVAGASAAQILGHYYTGTSVTMFPQQPVLRIWMTDQTDGTAQVTGTAPFILRRASAPGAPIATVAAGQTAEIRLSGGQFTILVNGTPVGSPIPSTSEKIFAVYDPTTDAGVTASIVRLNEPDKQLRWGRLEFTDASSNLRVVVDALRMQEYLYGLGEMPSSWPIEALKAQAIAARTYAVRMTDVYPNGKPGCSCNLYGTTADQAYDGYSKETGAYASNWKSSIDQTAGLIVTYNGRAILAQYSSSSGGHTEDSLAISSFPYLKGVPDPWDEAAATGDIRVWRRSFTGADLETWLRADSATNVGNLRGIEVEAPYGVSGRVLDNVVIYGDSGSPKVVSASTFRAVVNAGLSAAGRFSSEQMRSNLFQLGFENYPHGFRGGVFIAGGRNTPLIVTGAGEGGGPHVVVTDVVGRAISGFFAYDPAFSGGVRVALCDLDGDHVQETIITGAGPGGGPHVRTFGSNGSAGKTSFFPYPSGFRGGVYVACGDVDGVAGDELITGAGPGGGPHVLVFNIDPSTGDPTVTGSFWGFSPSFPGGVRLATGNVAGDTRDEIIVGAGPGGGPHVRILRSDGSEIKGFFAFETSFSGGVYVGSVAVSPTEGYVGVGKGDTGSSELKVMNSNGDLLWSKTVFGGVMQRGVRVSSVGGAVITSTGNGAWPLVKVL